MHDAMIIQDFETEVAAMGHLMVSLQTILHSMQVEGAKPDLFGAAIFLADELEQQLACVTATARRLAAASVAATTDGSASQ